VQLSLGTVHFVIILVYLPVSKQPLFLDELSTALETQIVLACPVVIGGNLNVKFQLTGDSAARRMYELLTHFDMVQHVKGPTHNRGFTLDLVITPSTCPLNGDVHIEPVGRYSDQSLVLCSLLP